MRSYRMSLSPSDLWSKVKSGSSAVFRALGFGLAIVLFRSLSRPFGKSVSEPIKVAIYSNRTIALLRSLVHVIPFGLAVGEIILNWQEHYLGGNVQNISYYQYAAKAHEICIQASLATILFAYIRFEMALGHGLPFGALFSGLQLNQVSTLWSAEFWASATTRHLPIQRRLSLVCITFICITLAAVGGPSSAILLIPRLDYWPAGHTSIWINVTRDDLWPSRLTGTSIPQSCSSLSGTTSSPCPASEWQSILNFLELAARSVPETYQEELNLFVEPEGVPLTGQGSFRTMSTRIRNSQGNVPIGYDLESTQSTTPQSVIADALQATADLYEIAVGDDTGERDLVSRAQGRDHYHTINKMYYQPYTSTTCGVDVIRSSADQLPIYFPIPPGSLDPQMMANTTINSTAFKQIAIQSGNRYISGIEYSGVSRSDLLNAAGNVSDYRLMWFELPQDLFNGSTIGASVLYPRHSTDALGTHYPASWLGVSTQPALFCTLSAGWGTSLLNVSSDSEKGVSSSVNLPQSDLDHPLYQGQDPSKLGYPNGNMLDMPLFPQKPITISTDWADYLNPFLPDSNMTVFSKLMNSSYGAIAQPSSASIILSSLLANGLARTSFWGQLQGTARSTYQPLFNQTFIDGAYWLSGKGDVFQVTADESQTWTKFEVDTTVSGYSYSTRGTAAKLAIAFLLVYCILVVIHFAYAGVSGISSTSWDSVAEVTALAANSTPTKELQNTCAGITEHRIFELPVRVLVTPDEEGDGEHLEMVFGDVDDEEAEKRRIIPGRVYGRLPEKKQSETGSIAAV